MLTFHPNNFQILFLEAGRFKKEIVPIKTWKPIFDEQKKIKWDEKGDEITIQSRIMCIADIFDALSSERPYRPPWPREKVLAHILSLAGTHLDTKVVDLFLGKEKDLLSWHLSSDLLQGSSFLGHI